MSPPVHCRRTFPVRDYDLAATLACGQAFRWSRTVTDSPTASANDAWTGVVGGCWVKLRLQGRPVTGAATILAETAQPQSDWDWLADYLQVDVDIAAVLAQFPDDPPMREAMAACRGLRLLRQEPWECLASFILSSTKQIVQIRQIIARLCEGFGTPVAVPPGVPPVFAFPTPERLAEASEASLRGCLMGFRAPYLKATATEIAAGRFPLATLATLPLEDARAALMELPGVGRKIADCVLLFAGEFPTAFPIDVWVLRALRELYFPRRRVTMKRLRRFSESHFGPHGGYAQQYLFHYMRNLKRRPSQTS